MKRRVFLSATGAFGIAGVASGASVVSTIYSSLSTSVSLEEFSPKTKAVLDRFVTELAMNFQENGLDEKHIARVAMPVRIIRKDFDGNNHQLIYKNKIGNYVELSINDDVEIIRIVDEI